MSSHACREKPSLLRRRSDHLARSSQTWIDLELEFLAGILHGVGKHSARGKVVIILGLKEKDGSAGMANAASHQRLKFGRLRPALGTACRIDRRAIGAAFGA